MAVDSRHGAGTRQSVWLRRSTAHRSGCVVSTSDRKPALTMHQLREIAAQIATGESPTKLADEFEVTLSALDDSLAAIAASIATVSAKRRENA